MTCARRCSRQTKSTRSLCGRTNLCCQQQLDVTNVLPTTQLVPLHGKSAEEPELSGCFNEVVSNQVSRGRTDSSHADDCDTLDPSRSALDRRVTARHAQDGLSFAELLRWHLLPRLDDMAEHILDSPPFAGSQRPGEREDVTQSVRLTVRLLTEAMFDDAQPEDALETWRRIGARRARHRATVEQVLTSFDTAMWNGFHWLMREAWTLQAEPVAVRRVLDVLHERLGRRGAEARSALLSGYHHESAVQSGINVRTPAELLDRLFDGAWEDEAVIRSEAEAVGISPDATFTLLLVVGSNGGKDLSAARKVLVATLPDAVEGPTRGSPQPHATLLMRPGSLDGVRDELDAAATRQGVVVIELEARRLVDELAVAYSSAARNLVFLPAVTPRPGVVPAGRLSFHRALHGGSLEDRGEEFGRILGGVIETPNSSQMLDTLCAFLETREGAQGAADALGVHVNTVRQRRRRVEELTFRNWEVEADRHELLTAAAWGRGLRIGPTE